MEISQDKIEENQLFTSLLASGSDDQHTIVWDPLHHKKLLSMHTGHTANIFSVKS
ncbi:WD and tetratricopeptide repeats protein [Saguinus oedipus]|uniref:WD and tetratricopeptide repeats protein n=1 Tax=Saguinus oedipus TaxID=9490 RepID=A0ABQ9VAJ0_SAGOE|nr:WD and tetratricopeptide repeats protein [Saguinus oedipus]